MSAPATLHRTLSLPWLVLYGLGTTIGAGIYALTGEVAGIAGMNTPLAFLVATALAAFSALSFAELSGRHPQSAGEAVYVKEAFGVRGLALVVGLLVVSAGSVSAATIANAFSGYLRELVALPHVLAIVLLVVLLGAIAAWGVRLSVGFAGVVTLLEIGGLLAVLWVARASLAGLPAALPEIVTPAGGAGWAAVLSAGVLAFYAFLGFEDMVNVAEEVRDVRRVLPLAIVITLVVTAVLYAALATVCVLSVPPEELAESEAPLALVFSRATGASPAILGAVGVIALVNGALIQIVMAARVLYGLARDHRWLAALGRVHPVTRTPLVATVVVSAIVLVLAIAFPLEPLARTTSLITLVVFAAVNLALIVLKRRGPPPEEVSEVPAWVPLGGFAISLGFVAWELRRLLVS